MLSVHSKSRSKPSRISSKVTAKLEKSRVIGKSKVIVFQMICLLETEQVKKVNPEKIDSTPKTVTRQQPY